MLTLVNIGLVASLGLAVFGIGVLAVIVFDEWQERRKLAKKSSVVLRKLDW